MPPHPYHHESIIVIIASLQAFAWLASPLLCVTAFSSSSSKYVSLKLNLAPQQLGEFKPINLVINEDGDAEEKDIDRSKRRVWLYDFVSSNSSTQQTSADTIPYIEAWDLQKRLMEEQLSRIGKRPKDPPLYDQFIPVDANEKNIDSDSLMGCDSIIMLQHDPVYTLGTASDTSFIHGYDDDDSGEESQIPIVRIERGGEVTYRKSLLNLVHCFYLFAQSLTILSPLQMALAK